MTRPRGLSSRLWPTVLLLSCGTPLLAQTPPAATLPVPATAPGTQPAGPRLAAAPTFLLHEIRFTGNTVISNAELHKAVAKYLDRDVTSDDLEEARRAVTQVYIDQGYITSGAVIPDQSVSDGVVTMQIVEGKLSDIAISGNTWLRSSYLRKRIEIASGPPLNIVKLRDQLEILRDGPLLESLNAELKPGATSGQSVLDVKAKEANPFQLGLTFDNNRSPAVGAERLSAIAADADVSGNGDSLSVRYGITRGGLDAMEFNDFRDFSITYQIPVTPVDTVVGITYLRSDDVIIEDAFASLDLGSTSRDYTLFLRQPLYRTPATEFALTLSGSFRENRTTAAGVPFPLSPGADADGRSKVTVLRFGQEFTTHGPQDVLSLRSTFSFGLDALGATTHNDGEADSRFVSWMGQGQYVRRLGNTDWRVYVRGMAQFSSEALMSMEQFGVGGMDTVRGYRENRLVRDQAVVGSVELRYPVLKVGRDFTVEAAAFGDVGYGWDHQAAATQESPVLSSVGPGVLVHLTKHIEGAFYYGYPFKHFSDEPKDLQDYGIHFRLMLYAF